MDENCTGMLHSFLFGCLLVSPTQQAEGVEMWPFRGFVHVKAEGAACGFVQLSLCRNIDEAFLRVNYCHLRQMKNEQLCLIMVFLSWARCGVRPLFLTPYYELGQAFPIFFFLAHCCSAVERYSVKEGLGRRNEKIIIKIKIGG